VRALINKVFSCRSYALLLVRHVDDVFKLLALVLVELSECCGSIKCFDYGGCAWRDPGLLWV